MILLWDENHHIESPFYWNIFSTWQFFVTFLDGEKVTLSKVNRDPPTIVEKMVFTYVQLGSVQGGKIYR